MERWLRDDVKPNLSGNTYATYESMWRVHAKPTLASVQLEKLDVPHVERLYSTMRKGGTSSSVIQRVATIMSRAISVAARRQVYFRSNPFALVDKPKHRHKETAIPRWPKHAGLLPRFRPIVTRRFGSYSLRQACGSERRSL